MVLQSTHWALPIHATFSDLDNIWRSQQCQKVLTEFFMFVSNSAETLQDCYVHLVDHEFLHHFLKLLHSFKGDDLHILTFVKRRRKKSDVCISSDTIKVNSFKLWMIVIWLKVYIVFLGLMTVTLCQGAQMCQKHKLQIVLFRLLSTVV